MKAFPTIIFQIPKHEFIKKGMNVYTFIPFNFQPFKTMLLAVFSLRPIWKNQSLLL